MSHEIITAENYDALVTRNEKTVLLDFWATWCGPCRMIAPLMEQVSQERADVMVGKVDVDSEPGLAAQFGIISIPTLVVLKGGKETARLVGYRPKEEILALLDK